MPTAQDNLTKQIEDMAADAKKDLLKGPKEVNAERLKELYTEYLDAKAAAKGAPTEAQKAEEAFLRKKHGVNYDNFMKSENKKKAKVLVADLETKEKQLVEKGQQAFRMYESVTRVAATSVDDYLSSIRLHMSSLREFDNSASFEDTNQRKTYYLNLQKGSLGDWDTIVTLFILSLSLVFANHVFLVKRQFRNIWMWVILLGLWLCSYLLPLIIRWIISIPQPVNIYNTWANNGPKEWHGDDL